MSNYKQVWNKWKIKSQQIIRFKEETKESFRIEKCNNQKKKKKGWKLSQIASNRNRKIQEAVEPWTK